MLRARYTHPSERQAELDSKRDLSPTERAHYQSEINEVAAEITAKVVERLVAQTQQEFEDANALANEAYALQTEERALRQAAKERRISASEFARESRRLLTWADRLEGRSEEVIALHQETLDNFTDPLAVHANLLRKYTALQGLRFSPL